MVVGFTAGIPKIPLNLALLKNCQIMGVFLGAMAGQDPGFVARMTREIDELCASGALSPRIGATYTLDQAPQAFRDMMDRRAVGRLVITP